VEFSLASVAAVLKTGYLLLRYSQDYQSTYKETYKNLKIMCKTNMLMENLAWTGEVNVA